MWRRLALAVLLVTAAGAADAQAGTLRAGAGRADISPPTGYYFMGWVRSDAVGHGQLTRQYARALVLERDGRKVALVAMDAGAISGGVVKEVAERLKDRGFDERNILVSASHTHGSPTGWYSFSTYNTVFMTTGTPTEFNVTGALDPQLYAFMVTRLETAIRRADDDLAPAVAGWGSTRITDLTRNRSLEAHLHNHGIVAARGDGLPEMDPLGALHTIDPVVKVLRVDHLARRGKRRVPIGIWSTFANHGTTIRSSFPYYGADHHGSATRLVEQEIRAAGRVPAGQDVVNAYGNTDEGDQSAGLENHGPAWADEVGRREAAAMLTAWRAAATSLTATPELDLRWTRVCFCGQDVGGGKVDDQPVIGLPLTTGSEEGRGPLYDTTGVPFEDQRSPVADPEQGHKIQVLVQGKESVPVAVPLTALRVADHVVVSIPGEMTAGMGERVRAATLEAARPAGVADTVISGLANEYLSYFVTPEEYDRQHYEGGSQLYGRLASLLLQNTLADLAGRLARGEPEPEPFGFDPRNGVSAGAEPFGTGAEQATATAQPDPVERLERARFAWRGGPRGLDRPLDRAFIRLERRVTERTGRGRKRKTRTRWVLEADDLGLQVFWRVDEDGGYEAHWEVPISAPAGTYRFAITANRYRLESDPFGVAPHRSLAVWQVPGSAAVELRYPVAVVERDVTYRPPMATGGRVAFEVDGSRRMVRRVKGTRFAVRARPGARIAVPAGAATDRYGNANREPLTFTAP